VLDAIGGLVSLGGVNADHCRIRPLPDTDLASDCQVISVLRHESSIVTVGRESAGRCGGTVAGVMLVS
jgi:hypothetical protein